ncbi:ParA family protein [Dysosmobacter sp.]
MRTIAIFNLKGGVAKTMTTAALADILAIDHKKRVLVIDADGQGNLSQYYGVKADEGNSLLALLQGEHEAYYGR